MKKLTTQLSYILQNDFQKKGDEGIAHDLREIVRKGEGDFIYVTREEVRAWRTKQTFPHKTEVKRALLSYTGKDKFSDLVLSKHDLELLIRHILHENFKKVLAKDNSKYNAYDVHVMYSALNINASSTTLTQAIILNYLYKEAELKNISNIRLINLDNASNLISFVETELKSKNGFEKIEHEITEIWDDLTLPRIRFKSIEKPVLRHTLSILWSNQDYLI